MLEARERRGGEREREGGEREMGEKGGQDSLLVRKRAHTHTHARARALATHKRH